MPADPLRSSELEIAHVLFMDMVGYTLLPIAGQIRARRELQELVRRTEEFRRSETRHELICLPSGDGMALAFFRDPGAPVRCALEIAAALRGDTDMRLRMGLHSGPILKVDDINAGSSVAGGGINIAQRVMDCGDAGHILLSSTIVELLGQLDEWTAYLHDLGVHPVKHGVPIHLFSLYTAELGSSALPSKLKASHYSSASPSTRSQVRPATAATRIAILYKRHAQPDEQLLRLMETQLEAHGCQVFIDRHLAIGIEWAKEIERQVRTSDAVIPLLSEASVHSEMLAYEVQTAHEAACRQQGRPRLLPVRVQFTGGLPEPVSAILDPLHHFLWEGPQDDKGLLQEMVEALESPAALPAAIALEKLEPVGGAVPLDSAFYVVRPADEELRTAIARQDGIVLIKGARQMGKTSLLGRGLQQAREAGARVALTDLQQFNAAHLESAEAFFLAVGAVLADQLDLEAFPDQVWDTRFGPSMNFSRYMRREVLRGLDRPLVWGLDEVDQLSTCDFGSEVFGLFRSWYNQRVTDPGGPWSRLTLVIAYATEAHLFIANVNQSPFNVGTRLVLEDFTFEQVADLNHCYGSPLRDEAEILRYCGLVSGHPYLVRRGLHEMTSRGVGLADIEREADRDEGIFGDHLRRILIVLARSPNLLEVLRGVLRGKSCPDSDSFYRLRSAGIVSGDSARNVRPRCQLYAAYLERHLLQGTPTDPRPREQ